MTCPLASRILVCIALCAVVSCAGKRPQTGPRHAQPAGVRPNQMVASVGPFEDTNGNGYPDSATVSVYVFSDAYPEASVMVPATLLFRLAAKGVTLREWHFDEAQAAGLVRRGPVGLGYVVRLSLLDSGQNDQVTDSRGELTVTFRAAEGVALTSVPESVRIGRSGRP